MIRPTGNNVVIEPIEEKIGTGVITIPDGCREASNYGKVLAVGPKVSDVSVGDTVFCGKYEGRKVQLDVREVRIVPFEAILATYEPAEIPADLEAARKLTH